MINAGDTVWVLTSTGLVLFMVPGLALFYGGMVSSRNVLVMLQQNIFPLGLISLLWVLIGYSLAFGRDAGGGVIGNLDLFGLRDLGHLHHVAPGVAIPTLAFVAYMMMFAIITPALITGATANRLKFAGYAVVIGLWSVIVYAPVAHWLWSPSGWLAKRGAEDWAGGLVVHASAGSAVLALLLVIGHRRRWPNAATPPHAVPLVVLGAGILWFGWFGFNAADGLQANGVAAQALMNTQVAAAAAMLVWLLVDHFTDGHATVLGAVTGAVAGLATITPCAGYVDTYSAIIIGGLAGLICHLALRLKVFLHLDDALDVIAVHFIGGVFGDVPARFLRRPQHQLDRRERRVLWRRRSSPGRAGAGDRRGGRFLVLPDVANRDGRGEDDRTARLACGRRRPRPESGSDVGLRIRPRRGRDAIRQNPPTAP